MKESAGPEKGGRRAGPTGRMRSWVVSLAWAAAIVGVAVAVSAVINPALGRSVHWDWMAGLASTLFAALSIALRRRWV